MDRSEVLSTLLSQSLQKDRLYRLKNIKTLLGQPDLLTIIKVTTISSFLSNKKVVEREQKFVFGLNLPTTAHFSSYMTARLQSSKKTQKSQSAYKIKFFMYDIFHRIDFHLQINIPGSLQIKAHNLNGQPVNTSNIDYQSVYLSSVLRSLYPYYYHPCTQIYGQVENYLVLEDFVRTFVPFAVKNQLQIPQELAQIDNIGIELLINYLTTNNFHNLSNILVYQLSKISPQKSILLTLTLKQQKQQYKQIALQCAQHLLKQNLSLQMIAKLREFQVRALCKMRKKNQAKILAQGLIRQGLDQLQTWEQVLKIWFQEEDGQRNYLKLLNTAINFTDNDILFRDKLQKFIYPKKLHFNNNQKYQKNTTSISHYPQYMQKFDYFFMQNLTPLKSLQQSTDKLPKQRSTSQLLHRLDYSYQKQSFFQKFITLYQKQKGWTRMIQQRAQTFWLENDYINYQNLMKKKASQMSYRFMGDSHIEGESSHISNSGNNDSKDSKDREKINKLMEKFAENQQQQQSKQQRAQLEQSFDGQFSDADSVHQSQIHQVVAPCSKRVATKRVSRELAVKKPQAIKIISSYSLDNIFLISFNNLKLHADIQKWSTKIDFTNIHQLTKQKKELLAYIFLKKGFFHKQILRFRKSQEAFKIARKCSAETHIQLIACYCLAKLYLEHNNIKGVEFYTVQIMRILFALGVQKFDAVPYWAKQIIPYIIKNYGKAITKRLQGPLKQIVELWLRIDNKPVKP